MFRPITGADLKRMRLSANRTTEQMAKVAGVSRVTYESWEKGKSEPRMNQSYALQAYCQINLSPIFSRFDELKKEFDRYKMLVDDKQPNQLRASARKNHLNGEPGHEPETSS
ncbi:helix-turn-helix transcriptional regulator [Thalassomonas actiniarum]|uniref:Helix-turn-helix domain-containing protein n=1 Tax=Thalassomonas actiniarum TaxID=485447 RepID=A0AAF0C5G7_9GAMM|nr:helix-turn-helix domain-containing protein [Thalassomonas actiniarum]WDE01004.1 helix-turn-helix domain-containing protein [Thalassomonas actiniarum]